MGLRRGVWDHAVDGVSLDRMKIDMVGGSQPLTLHFHSQVMSCSDAALQLAVILRRGLKVHAFLLHL